MNPASQQQQWGHWHPTLNDAFERAKIHVRLQDNDVLIGKGTRLFNHYGNKQLLTLAASQAMEYTQTKRRSDKNRIVTGIMETISSRGGRFLIQDVNGWYICFDEKVSRAKVGHTLRDLAGGKIKSAVVPTRNHHQRQQDDNKKTTRKLVVQRENNESMTAGSRRKRNLGEYACKQEPWGSGAATAYSSSSQSAFAGDNKAETFREDDTRHGSSMGSHHENNALSGTRSLSSDLLDMQNDISVSEIFRALEDPDPLLMGIENFDDLLLQDTSNHDPQIMDEDFSELLLLLENQQEDGIKSMKH